MANTKVKNIDVTKTGPQSFNQLLMINNSQFGEDVSPEVRDFIMKGRQRANSFTLYDPYGQAEQGVSSSLAGTTTPWGKSMFDNPTATEAQFQELGDIRAENQPWYAKIGAGLTKGAILAGTTFLDGTIGLLFGAGTAAKEGRISGLWDNDFSKAMQAFNEGSEQILPNYYTRAEQENPWYENIFTANFLGDKFIKNLGFTVGAFYSGGVTAAGLKATKLPQLIGAIAKSSKAPAMVNTAVGTTISALNEGRIEAINNSKDWFQFNKAQLDNNYKQRMQAIKDQYEGTEIYESLLNAEKDAYNEALGKLSEDRLKMGNVDLLMNLPILTASNFIQFGKLYANGFKTARRTNNIVNKAGVYTTGTTKLGTAAAITKGALSEGTEEISQKAASEISGNYYSTDVNNFYKAKTDLNASQETLSWTKSFAEGINKIVNDGSSWEEFFIGSLTGALGIPRFRSIRNESGSLQSPITLEGGIKGGIKDYIEKTERENRIVDYLNNRINSPEFKNYYQGLIRHNKYQNDMNKAVEEGNEFDFKNAEHALLVSDISMFDNAGKMEDLTTLIDAAFDTSDENLASIVENTTATLEDGSKVGPFVDKNGNPMYATPEGKQEMIEKLKLNHDEMTNTINNYLKIKEELDTKTGQQLSDDLLEELTWMKSQIGNWSERAIGMSGEVKSAIGKVLGNLDYILKFNEQIRDYEGQSHAGLSEAYLQADKNARAIQAIINTLNNVRNQNDEVLTYILANNPDFTDILIKNINNIDDTTLSADKKEDIITKLNDIAKLGNASKTYNTKLKEYLENPQKLEEAHALADELVSQQETKRRSNNIKASLANAQNLQEFRTIIDNNIDDIDTLTDALNELELEGNEMAKASRETSQYNKEVSDIINSSDASLLTKLDALKLLRAQFNNSNNLNELANPNSIFINNENAFDEDSNGDIELSKNRFLEAQYELLKAISKVNNDNKFKDRFAPEYKVAPVKGTTGTIIRDTTGDSGVGTAPPVGSNNPIQAEQLEETSIVEVANGDTFIDNIIKENESLNDSTDIQQESTPRQPKDTNIIYQYYRPAIPELHIKASKEGDFRPFDVVVSEREEGVDFSIIYNYLKNNGAFDYLNKGNLKVGDEIGFMIDPLFEESVKDKLWHTAPTIFLIDKKNNLIVGSLDEGFSVDRFEGLKELEERVREEYNKNSNKADKFIAAPTTKVSKIMIGKIPYSKEERSLGLILEKEQKPIFGIIKNGILVTNNAIKDEDIIKPTNMSAEGRLYLLIPNGANKYSPAAVRVKHFNKDEFNINDTTVANSIIGEEIKESLTKLSSATSQDEVSSAMQELSQDLYLQDVMVTWFNGARGSGIVISKKLRNTNGSYVTYTDNEGKVRIKEDKQDIYFSNSEPTVNIGGIDITGIDALRSMGIDLNAANVLQNRVDSTVIFNNILEAFYNLNVPILVSTNQINNEIYNKRLVNSNVLTSNLTSATTQNTWFTTDYFDKDGRLLSAKNPTSIIKLTFNPITPTGGIDSVIQGTPILIDNKAGNATVYVDTKTNTLRNNFNRDITNSLTQEEVQKYLDLAWAQENYGIQTNVRNVMLDNKIITPSGRVLDRTTQKYLNNIEAQDIKDKINKRDNPITTTSELAKAELSAMNTDDEFEDEFVLREAKEGSYTEWNQEKELNWLSKVLPQLKENERVIVTKGLIHVSKNGATAWGKFDNGIITLSDIAAEGTTYHEAFHAVFRMMLTEEERANLYEDAKKMYGNKSNLFLEEDMAEGFREYIMTRQNAGLVGKVKNFFKDLYIKVTNWNSVRPHLYAYYLMINKGKYANTFINDVYRLGEYTQEMKDILTSVKRDSEGYLLATNNKRSNLNERQWVHVRTKAFKEWFGDWENNPNSASKVIDENGEPLVVYHGTKDNWNILNPDKFGSNTDEGYYGKGLYLSSVENKAKQYGSTMSLFVNIKNPLLVGMHKELSMEEATKNAKLAYQYNRGGKEDVSSIYDGVLYSGTEGRFEEIVITSPNQIKSATDNIGTYSTINDDIRYRTVPNSSFSILSKDIQENLLNKGWTEEKFNAVSLEEKNQAIKCIAF